MNNLPLQPINWRTFKSIVGVSCDATTPICEYDVWQSDGSWVVEYYNRQTEDPTKIATGFATIDDAKTWAWNHYNEKMQPYVKPAPTWIDVNERLPDKEDFYLVYVFDGHREENVIDILWWNPDHQQFLEWGFMNNVTHWMPLPNPPEFSIMQNLHKGE